MKENGHLQRLGMPCCHVVRLAWAIGTGAEKSVVEVRIDVMDLHESHQVLRVDAAGKPAIGPEDVITDSLRAGDAFVTDIDGARAMFKPPTSDKAPGLTTLKSSATPA
jgi:hypothetical protein